MDFFSFNEVDPLGIQAILKSISPRIDIRSIDYQQSFNRNLFFLHFENEVIKTEFTYYPFTQVEKPHVHDHVLVDSLIDIAVNKMFTIYQKPRSRDFIDLYTILKINTWTMDDLKKKARIKFDMHIDPLQLAQQLLEVTVVKDYPHMIVPLEPDEWQKFWLTQATQLKGDVLK